MANYNNIACRWRELSGENGWDCLLQPLDLDLRRYIIHYGERAGAVGDLYNKDGQCPKEECFKEACLEKGNDFKYDVTHYLYAGSNVVESSWFGFVAVSTDEGKAVLGRRDILISWRGTITYSEWFNNINVIQVSASDLFGTDTEALVHSGFHNLYTGTRPDSIHNKTSARAQVLEAVRELMNKYQDEEVSITVVGFSLGGALATLNAMDIVANGYNTRTNTAHGVKKLPCMVTAFVYGCPRVGNQGLEKEYKRLVDRHNLRLLRITNANDPVHKVPILFYVHLGNKLKVNSSKSEYLKPKWFGRRSYISIVDPELVPVIDGNIQQALIISGGGGMAEFVSAHNMEVYMHAIAGVQKDESKFHLEVDRDIALVNKHLDRLKKEYEIPTHWWSGENRKKMVQKDDGHWEVINYTT